MSINDKKLGLRIKEYRLKDGMTQKELALKCNLSVGYISDLETGQKTPTLETLNLLAGELGSSVDELLVDSLEVYIKNDNQDINKAAALKCKLDMLTQKEQLFLIRLIQLLDLSERSLDLPKLMQGNPNIQNFFNFFSGLSQKEQDDLDMFLGRFTDFNSGKK